MISIHIPENAKNIDIDSEISSARNIKDKTNRNATTQGLLKIKHYL